jgi:outer membrane lipoprotein
MKLSVISSLIAIVAILTLNGCAPTFSREVLDKVDRNITFRDLQADPEQYQGKWIMLGGIIVETRNTQDGTFIEVLQTPTDRQGRPKEADASQGRYIIESPEFFDSTVYYKGKPLSVVGEVKGRKVGSLGEMQYRYPVITAKEIRLWEPKSSPRFSFGVGVGVFHRY